MLKALHNISWYLTECGRFRKARMVLFDTRDLYLKDGEPLNLLRLSWLEGRIYSGLGSFERAEAAFETTRSGFEQVGKTYDAALCSLDLAMLWARQDRREELKRLCTELVAAFRRHGIAREAIAALLLARQECGRDWISNEDLWDRFKAISALVTELQHQRKRRSGRRG